MVNFFASEKLSCMYPGPRNWFLPVLPRPGAGHAPELGQPAGCENEEGSNHCLPLPMLCSTFRPPIIVAPPFGNRRAHERRAWSANTAKIPRVAGDQKSTVAE